MDSGKSILSYQDNLIAKSQEVFETTKKEMRSRFMTIHNGNKITFSIDTPIFHTLELLNSLFKRQEKNLILEDALFNATNLLESSFVTAIQGQYRIANSELRATLDDTLTRCYFDELKKEGNLPEYPKNQGKTNDYIEWSHGWKKEYPSLKEIYDKLKSNKQISKYNKKYELIDKIKNHYSTLSKFTHNRPDTLEYKTGSTIQTGLTNIRFDKEEFNNYDKNLQKTHEIMMTILFLKLPEYVQNNTAEFTRFKEMNQNTAAQIENTIKETQND